MFAFIRLSHSLRRAIAVAMLLAYVVVMSGAPLPAGKVARKSGELYPCSDCSCGCDSAEHCWRNCCCHTLAERLDWAKEHNVRPPEFALAEARSTNFDTSTWDGSRKKVTVAIAAHSCCCKKAAAERTCCSQRKCSHGDGERTRNVVGWRALACHGQSTNWLAAVPTLISVDLQLADQLPRVAWLGPHSSESAAGVADVPTPPPPERA